MGAYSRNRWHPASVTLVIKEDFLEKVRSKLSLGIKGLLGKGTLVFGELLRTVRLGELHVQRPWMIQLLGENCLYVSFDLAVFKDL